MKLSGHTILITGGSSGIGLELAGQLLALDNTVIITGRDAAKLEAARAKHPQLHTLVSDVTDPEAMAALHAQVLQRFPALNILVNNAGIIRRLNLHTLGTNPKDIAALAQEVSTNLVAPVQMTQMFLPHLKAQKVAAIINVSSGLAFVPFPVAPVYAATKAALHSYTQSLRIQMANTRVQVFELAPPATATPFNDGFSHAELDPSTLMDTTKMVRAAVRALQRGTLEIVPGPSAILRFLSRWAPSVAQLFFKKSVQLMLAEAAN